MNTPTPPRPTGPHTTWTPARPRLRRFVREFSYPHGIHPALVLGEYLDEGDGDGADGPAGAGPSGR
ncbi:hypothetical protein [Micrococcus luteus]|uniref:hypothetical protein n=1 Tax=Micrococcus luteus TaxID=1270 RepID=UPI0015D6A345|nr:hypothetical protein [Micrococcus luteus]